MYYMFSGSAYLFAIIKYFPLFFSVYSFCNATFFHSGYVIKPPQPSSAIYGISAFYRQTVDAGSGNA